MPKFTKVNVENAKPIVAYINKIGDLCIRPSEASLVRNGVIFVIADPVQSHRPALEDSEKWNPEDPDNKAVFREGDSITITF